MSITVCEQGHKVIIAMLNGERVPFVRCGVRYQLEFSLDGGPAIARTAVQAYRPHEEICSSHSFHDVPTEQRQRKSHHSPTGKGTVKQTAIKKPRQTAPRSAHGNGSNGNLPTVGK